MSGFVVRRPVAIGSIAIIAAFLGVGVWAPGQAETLFSSIQAWVLMRFGWFYLLSVAIFVASAVALALGRTGDLKLGPDESEPDFPFLSWLAMLFAAGMGIGLIYFAVGEPLMHAAAPPDAAPGTVAAQRDAMAITFFHWGVHAWAVYAIVGLSLAYFGYRYNLPLSIRSGLYPLLKNRINGPIGHAVDIFAICGTVFGIAASLGFGVMQIGSGLRYLTGLEAGPRLDLILIAVVTLVAALSAASGVERGVRRLSELNLIVALLLMLFVLVAGPTELLARDFVQNTGAWLSSLVARSFNIYAYDPKPWIDRWTLFYWAWWISWSPFVGMFIARISRGRTVREFIVGVLLAPTAMTFVWMTVFGNTAMFVDAAAHGALTRAVHDDLSVALFQFFSYLPWPTVSSAVAVALTAIFFITSADSGSLVVDALASGGELGTPWWQRAFWCVLEGVSAAVLLLTGGLAALQAATIAAALPFCIIMLALTWGLFRGMRADLAQASVRVGALAGAPASGPGWRQRVSLIVRRPGFAEVASFINNDAAEALAAVARELSSRGLPARVHSEDGHATLSCPAEGVRDFIYGVRCASWRTPCAAMADMPGGETPHEARTYFADGSRGYDIMGFTREQIIMDVLAQYETWRAVCQEPATVLVASAPGHAPPEDAAAGPVAVGSEPAVAMLAHGAAPG